MSLIDDLREVGKTLPYSHTPSDGELKGVIGALVLLVEHGPEAFDIVKNDSEKLLNLLSTGDPHTAPETIDPAVQAAADQVQAQKIADLEQQVQTLIALNQRTQGSVIPNG